MSKEEVKRPALKSPEDQIAAVMQLWRQHLIWHQHKHVDCSLGRINTGMFHKTQLSISVKFTQKACKRYSNC